MIVILINNKKKESTVYKSSNASQVISFSQTNATISGFKLEQQTTNIQRLRGEQWNCSETSIRMLQNLIQNSDNSIANDKEVDAVGRRKKESSNLISLAAPNINLVFS